LSRVCGATPLGVAGISQTVTHAEVSRYQRNGNSWCVIIPPKIREALCLVPRDLVLIRVVEDMVVMRRFDPARILSRQEAREAATRVQREAGQESSDG
jgi:bifunctional DNA-binding transcriptional regulator/antitoxin component of YhaV-PrlF toxin-antitoxin module